jgi:O-antigen ligase
MQLILQQLSNRKQIALWVFVIAISVSMSIGIVANAFWVLIIPIVILVLLASLFYTEETLLLSGAFVPLSMNFDNLGGGFGLSLPTEPLYIWLFGLFCFQLFKEGKLDLSALKNPIVAFVTGYLIWLWISTAFSTMPAVSAKFSMARTWYIVLFFYIGVRIFKNPKRIHFYFKWFTIFTMIMVGYTLFMHSQDGFTRGSSYGVSWPFFPDHGMYAAAIAYVVFLLLVYTFFIRHFGNPIGLAPILFLFFAIIFFAVIVSFTRATWLSFIVAFALWVLMQFKVKFYWIMVALFLVLSVGIVKQDEISYAMEANKQGSSDELEGHVKSVSNITTDPSNLERINRWKCAARMVAERPLFGFGPGTFVFKYAPFQKSSELTLISTHAGDLGDAHSEYFSAMSEMGFIGMFFWLGIVFSTIYVGFRIIYHAKSLKLRLITYMALMGLVAYHTHALLNNYSQYDKLAVPLWAFTAIIVAIDLRTRTANNG